MNEIVNKFLLPGDKFMLETYLTLKRLGKGGVGEVQFGGFSNNVSPAYCFG